MCAVWIDLLDPTRKELQDATPADLHPRAIELLNRESRHGDEPRPTLESHGDYVFGVFLVPKVDEDRSVVYREIDIVLTKDTLMTVRKSAGGTPAFQCKTLEEMHKHRLEVAKAGLIAYHLVDDVAEGFLDLTDGLNQEIDELEDHVEDLENS
ncbi:MAG: hypothetical protein QOI43_1087, partial [Gaiellales bacterium]|nr:hypothetical protein [Gaiellales bacterium]